MIKSITKNSVLAEDFKRYCDLHPDERFHQAYRNWLGARFVYVDMADGERLQDTFFWEEKTK
jgi:hypothetical protein